MPYFRLCTDRLNGWATLVFPNETTIPDKEILDELVNVPKPTSIVRLLDLYEIEGKPRERINTLLVGKNPPTWKAITKTIQPFAKVANDEDSICQLFGITSQFSYGKYARITDESMAIITSFSNNLVCQIESTYRKSQIAKKVYELCNKSRDLADEWIYNSILVNYCQNIMPHPFQTALPSLQELKPYTKTVYTDDFFGGGYDRRIENERTLLRRITRRFSSFVSAITRMDEIENILDPTESILNPIKQQEIEKTWDDNLVEKQGIVLCQCAYCYNFRDEIIPRNGKIPRYCDSNVNQACKKAENARRILISSFAGSVESFNR